MMTLLREALSWNYVLVTAVISSLLAQFTKVILNMIILGKFIPERLCGDRKSTRLNSSHNNQSRMPSSA